MSWTSSPNQTGIKAWTHQQTAPQSTWTISHNMGSAPMVEVLAFDGGVLMKAFPRAIVHVDHNTTRIEWSIPRTGQVNFLAT